MMNSKMYIPCSITLTEHEYLLIQQLARTLAPSNYAFSAAIRQIIREWEQQQSAVDEQVSANEKSLL
jgi:hypothetical protein